MTERKPFRAPSIDLATLKAFSHPLRMRMYDQLKDGGPATASMLARAMGESTGQTSYHLRQLERHGLVTEDVGRGTARERWWKAEGFSMAPDLAVDSEAQSALQVALSHWATRAAELQVQWAERQAVEAPEWVSASANSETTLRLTAQELSDLVDAVEPVLAEHIERARSRGDADDGVERRTVKIFMHAFPLPSPSEG